jgi:hypothetical protein
MIEVFSLLPEAELNGSISFDRLAFKPINQQINIIRLGALN